MKNLKNILCLLLGAILILSFAACGEPTTGGDSNEVNQQSDAATENTQAETEKEWQKFLADYDAWADDYIELVKKYEANPTDTTILNDYTQKASEVSQWSQDADKISEELVNSPEDLAEYTAELNKIAEKLADVAQ